MMKHLLEYDDPELDGLLGDLRGFGLADHRVKITIYYKDSDILVQLPLPGLDKVKGEITPEDIYKEIRDGKVEVEGNKYIALAGISRLRVKKTEAGIPENYGAYYPKSKAISLKGFLKKYKEDNMNRSTSQRSAISILIDGKIAASENNYK